MKQFQSYEADTDAADVFEQEPSTMPLMTGMGGGGALPGPDGFDTTSDNENKKLAQQSALIIMIISVVAFGALMAMRLTQADISEAASSSGADEFLATLEARLGNLDEMDQTDALHPDRMKALFADTDQIIGVIKADRTDKQVPIEEVKKNPFASVITKPVETVDTAAIAEQKRKDKLNSLYGELSRIEIQSVMGGSRPVAVIGGDLHRVGSMVGAFRLHSIDSRGVTFTVPNFELREGETPFILSIGNE